MHAFGQLAGFQIVLHRTEKCFDSQQFFIVIGGILYYFVMTVILWLKLDANDLKLFTAIIVALFLAVPYLQEKARSPFTRRVGKEG